MDINQTPFYGVVWLCLLSINSYLFGRGGIQLSTAPTPLPPNMCHQFASHFENTVCFWPMSVHTNSGGATVVYCGTNGWTRRLHHSLLNWQAVTAHKSCHLSSHSSADYKFCIFLHLELENYQEEDLSSIKTNSLITTKKHLEHSISSASTGALPSNWVHVQHVIKDYGRILSTWLTSRRNLSTTVYLRSKLAGGCQHWPLVLAV